MSLPSQSTPVPPPARPSPESTDHPARQWRSEDLLGPTGEALIVHGNETYRLRRTTTGKLILTK